MANGPLSLKTYQQTLCYIMPLCQCINKRCLAIDMIVNCLYGKTDQKEIMCFKIQTIFDYDILPFILSNLMKNLCR